MIEPRPPSEKRRTRDLEARVRELERALRAQKSAAEYEDIVYSLPGSVRASTSPRFYPRTRGTLIHAQASLGASSTATTAVDVKQSGVTIGTLTFGSGEETSEINTLAAPFPDSYLTFAVTAVGSGATDLTVQARFQK